jgi:hypothetical protein
VGLSKLPRIQYTTQVGWCGEAFVLPDTVIGLQHRSSHSSPVSVGMRNMKEPVRWGAGSAA